MRRLCQRKAVDSRGQLHTAGSTERLRRPKRCNIFISELGEPGRALKGSQIGCKHR